MKNRYIVVLTLQLLACGFLFTQESAVDENRATTIFSSQWGDINSTLFLQGFWGTRLTGSWGMGINTATGTTLDIPPSNLDPGIIYSQMVDLTISLWLFERLFFETTVKDDYQFNTFLIGYDGKNDEFLQSVRIGNTDIRMDEYGFLRIPRMPRHSLGATLKFQGENSQHELMLQFSPSVKQKKYFIGKNEVITQRLALSSYIQSRYFILPDDNIDFLEVYVEDNTGTITAGSRRFRKARADEMIYSLAQGYLFWKAEQGGQLLVYYEKAGIPLGSALMGKNALIGNSTDSQTRYILDPDLSPLDFGWSSPAYLGKAQTTRKIDLSLRPGCLLLADKTGFSPFALSNTYALSTPLPPEKWRVRTELVYKGEFKGEQLLFETDPVLQTIRIYALPTTIRDLRNRYPFVQAYPLLYGPDQTKNPAYGDKELLVQLLQPVDQFILEPDILPGSVEVTRNGFTETHFRVDAASGALIFDNPVGPDEEIEVHYRLSSPEAGGGDILFGWGNRFWFSENSIMDLGSSLRWRVPGSYTTKPEQSSGSILTTAGYSFVNDDLQFTINSGLSVYTPDTSGTYRILGMEDDNLDIPASAGNIFPASCPAATVDTYTLTTGLRGKLFYKNYRLYDASTTASLKPYNWNPPGDQIFAYEDGSKPGPYLTSAGGESGIDEDILTLDYTLAAGQWVGAQIPLLKHHPPPDLSGYSSVRFQWKALSIPSAVKVYVQIGAITEDLDGDNILDRELSPFSQGFSYNDSHWGKTLLIGNGPQGQGNNQLDSEDTDGNGVLDREEGSGSFIHTWGPLVPAPAWKSVELPISALTAAERRKLQSASAIRVIVVNSSAGGVSDKLLLTGFHFSGSSFYCDEKEVSTQEVPDTTLAASFPDVVSRFHAQAAGQRVLKVDWSSPPGDNWQISRFITPVKLSLYKNLSLYLKIPAFTASGSKQLTLELTDYANRGIHFSYTPGLLPSWQKLTIDLEKKQATLGGVPLAGSLSIDADAQELTQFRLSAAGTSSGSLYVDEVHFHDSIMALSAGMEYELEYWHPEPLWKIHDTILLDNFHIYQQGSAMGRGFASGFLESRENSQFTSYTLGESDLLALHAAVDIGLIWDTQNLSTQLGHRLRYPHTAALFSTEEFYNESRTAAEFGFSRGNSLGFFPENRFSLSLANEVFHFSDNLIQQWNSRFLSAWEAPLRLEADLGLGHAVHGFQPPPGNYFENWFAGYAYLLPDYGGTDPERSGQLRASITREPSPLGFEFSPALEYHTQSRVENSFMSQGEWLTALPLELNQGTFDPVRLTLGYRKSSAFKAGVLSSGYSEDFYYLGYYYLDQAYLHGLLPIVELVDDATYPFFVKRSLGLAQALYRPEIFFELSRTPGSRLSDLILPSFFHAAWARELTREADVTQSKHSFGLSLRNTALNLFGAKGSHPLLPLYETEKITSGFTMAVTANEDFVIESSNYIIQHIFSFFGRDKNSFTLENYLEILVTDESLISDSLKLQYTWHQYLKQNLKLADFIKKSEERMYIKNSEIFEYDTNTVGEAGENRHSFLFKHESSLIFPDSGKISAFLLMSFQKEVIQLIFLGFTLGVEASITF